MKIAEELRSTGQVDRGYTTGLIVQTVNKTISNYLNLPFLNGVIIIEVNKGSPADKIGLKPVIQIDFSHFCSSVLFDFTLQATLMASKIAR